MHICAILALRCISDGRSTQILHFNSSIVMRVSFANTPISLLPKTSTTTTVESFGHRLLPRWAPHACSPFASCLLYGCSLRPLRPPLHHTAIAKHSRASWRGVHVPHTAVALGHLRPRDHSGGTCERLEKSGAEMMRSILDIDLGIVALAWRSTNEAVGRDVNEKMATADSVRRVKLQAGTAA